MNPLPITVPASDFKGSRLARALLRLMGWQVLFAGFPAKRLVIVVYPHTSNWDFVVMILAKWSLGVQVAFWGKDKLFRVPLLGVWLRWLGGIAVDRSSPHGLIGQAVAVFEQHRSRDTGLLLALAPEGTRKYIAGLRSGFYYTALGAQVPLCLIRLDYGQREVRVLDFLHLSGDVEQDFAQIRQVYAGVQGLVPERAAPLQLLDVRVPRAEAVMP